MMIFFVYFCIVIIIYIYIIFKNSSQVAVPSQVDIIKYLTFLSYLYTFQKIYKYKTVWDIIVAKDIVLQKYSLLKLSFNKSLILMRFAGCCFIIKNIKVEYTNNLSSKI